MRNMARAISIFCLTARSSVAHLVAEPDVVHSQPGEMCAHLGLGGAPPDHSDRIGRRIGHQHVLEHRQVADERHLLKGGLDAALMGDPRAAS